MKPINSSSIRIKILVSIPSSLSSATDLFTCSSNKYPPACTFLPFTIPLTPTPALYLNSVTEGTSSTMRSEEHTSELQSRGHLVCRLLLEKKKKKTHKKYTLNHYR